MSKYRIYKSNVLESLEGLASYEFQKVVWFENDQGLCYSYGDAISDLYDDFHLEKALYDEGVIVFSKAADQALRDLNDVIESFAPPSREPELIVHPTMQVIRELAAKAIALIKASDGSESTEEIIEHP